MADYTKLSTETAQEIIDLYSLDKVVSIKPLSLGISNSNYEVQLTSKKVLLKISNDKNIDELVDEQRILNYLNSNNFKYSLKPFTTNSGKYVYQHDNLFGVIYPYVDGIPPGPSDQTCSLIGEGIAELHNIPKCAEIRAHSVVGFSAQGILNYTKTDQCPQDFKDIFNHIFPDQLQKYLAAPLEHGIIHGDLYYDNTLFNNNKLEVILDFEQAGVGEKLLDIGICISGTCLEKGRIIQPLIDSFIAGYEKYRKLPPHEVEYLEAAIILGLFSISLWRIRRFKDGNLNINMSDSYKELLAKATFFHQTKGK